jgi:MerR family mercuric resistance operon transcriptional regulator
VKRLAFVRRSRGLGFSIAEIRALLSLIDGGGCTCGEVKSMTDKHLEKVCSKIADLRRLERTLAAISSRCEGGEVPECPIIDALSEA